MKAASSSDASPTPKKSRFPQSKKTAEGKDGNLFYTMLALLRYSIPLCRTHDDTHKGFQHVQR